MLPDTALIRLLAAKVMGFVGTEVSEGRYAIRQKDGRYALAPASWNPLLSETDACAVLDKMTEKGFIYQLTCNPYARESYPDGDVSHSCVFYVELDESGKHYCGERRRAICLAALKACGVDTDA